jgi:hypothetical protein
MEVMTVPKDRAKQAEPKPPPLLPPNAEILYSRAQLRVALGHISDRQLDSLIARGTIPRACTRAFGDPCWRMSVVNKVIFENCEASMNGKTTH